MPELVLYVFGTPRIELDRAPVSMRLRKATALLVYLALNPRTHSRDTLATLLYPGYGQSNALGNLRRTLSSLNKAIGDQWLEIDRQSIALRPNTDLSVDVLRFRELIDQQRAHKHEDRSVCPDCVDMLREAVALYQDDFLTGFTLPDCPEFDQWQTQESEQLRQSLAYTLERVVRFYSAQGEFAESFVYARRWVTLDPLHEPAQRTLIALLAKSGQRSAALHQYEELERILRDELGVAPSTETVTLVEQIRRGDLGIAADSEPPKSISDERLAQQDAAAAHDAAHDDEVIIRPSAPSTRRHNLPSQMTPFVGREQELAELASLLADSGVRLVTILAPGGMGKTRLAQEVAVGQLPIYRNGVFFVELAPLRDVEGLAEVIADAVGYSLQPDGRSPDQQLAEYFADRQVLLVLDNFEHLLDGAALVHILLQAAPMLKVLVTSRERLRLSGETPFSLQGMHFPAWETPEEALEYDAVRYFLQSAQHARPDFKLSAANLPHVARICRLVDGMPLGILLASAWVEVLSTEEIAAEIEHSLDFLTGEQRDLPERQRSIRAVFTSSWQRLSPEEKTVFARLAIFQGGLTRSAAEAVAQATLPVLSALVSRSLLRRDADGRYQIHELLRQFAEEHLRKTDQLVATRDAHCTYYADFLSTREADLKGRRQLAALDEIEADWGNVRAAWLWAVERKRYDLVDRSLESLYLFCIMRSRLQAGQDLLRLAREGLAPSDETDPQPVWGRLMARAMKMNIRYLEPPDEVRKRVETGLAIAEARQERTEIAFCLWALGMTFMSVDDYRTALSYFDRSLQTYRELDTPFYLAWALYYSGATQAKAGIAESGALRESLELRRELHDRIGVAYSLHELGVMELLASRPFTALPYLQEAYALQREMGNRQGMAENLAGLTALALEDNDLALASSLTQEMQEIADDMNSPRHKAFVEVRLAQLSQRMDNLAESRCRYERILTGVLDHQVTCGAELGLSQVAAAEGNYQEAKLHLRRCLRLGVTVQTFHERYGYVLQTVLLAAHEGRMERAAALLALAFRESPERAEQLRKRPQVASLLAELKASLTPEEFKEAWARGQTLSWQDAMEELLAEWETEGSSSL